MAPAFRVMLAAIFCTAACGEGAESRDVADVAAARGDAGTDAALDWTNGGEDIPEYSLGRLLVSHRHAPELTLFDLDTSQPVARLPHAPRARVVAGGSGRYAYTFGGGEHALRVFDPGQWLLSHVDHFHVIRGEYRFLPEQLSVPMLSSLRAHDGWITAYAAATGFATLFQERSITAGSFAPQSVSLIPAAAGGVALVGRAQLLASEGAELTQRSVLAPTEVSARFAGCSEPRGIAAHDARVFIGCREGLLALRWDAVQELFLPELLPIAGGRVVDVRTTEAYDGAVLQIGAQRLGVLGPGGAPMRAVELPTQVVAFELRRQGTAAIVLTADGNLNEVDLASAAVTRSAALYAPLAELSSEAHFALSHAYAYLTDPRAPRIIALYLRSMQIEADLPLMDAAYDVTVVGMPSNYTDERE